MPTVAFILALNFCISSIVMPASCIETPAPGIVIRICEPGLNYAAEKGVEKFASQIKGSSDFIPDFTETTETTNVSVRNIRVMDIVTNQTNVCTDPGYDINWHMGIDRISLTGFFHCSNGPANDPCVGENFNIVAENVHVTTKVAIGIMSEERPIVMPQNCSASVEKVTISDHKNICGVDRKFMEISFRKMISGAVCQKAGDVITKNAAALLETLKLTEKVDNFTVDYSLIETPRLYHNCVETSHKGEFRNLGDIFGSPLLPPKFDPPKTAPSMVNFYVSDYCFNTLFAAMCKKKYFSAIVKKSDLPITNQSILATVSEGISVGSAFPGVSKIYPNDYAVLVIRATVCPVLTVKSDFAYLKSELKLSFLIEPANTRNVVVVTVRVKVIADVTTCIVGDKLTWKVHDLDLLEVLVINITGNVTSDDPQQSLTPDETILHLLLKIICKLFIDPMFNKVAATGFPLPILDGVHLVYPKVTTILHAFHVSTNCTYQPESLKPLK